MGGSDGLGRQKGGHGRALVCAGGGILTAQGAQLCPGGPGPGGLSQEGAGVLLFTTVCYAGEIQREVGEPLCACTHQRPALTQPPGKQVLPRTILENGLKAGQCPFRETKVRVLVPESGLPFVLTQESSGTPHGRRVAGG